MAVSIPLIQLVPYKVPLCLPNQLPVKHRDDDDDIVLDGDNDDSNSQYMSVDFVGPAPSTSPSRDDDADDN